MVCRDCGAEVRFGYRSRSPGWWHREEADHPGDPVIPPEVVEVTPLPEPELRAVDVDPAWFDGRSGPGGLRKLLADNGWTITYCKMSRGPYIGSKGEVLSISWFLVIKARSPVLVDKSQRFVIACWRDEKREERGYVGTISAGRGTSQFANATEMKDWIKSCESDNTSTSTGTESPPTLFEQPTTCSSPPSSTGPTTEESPSTGTAGGASSTSDVTPS